MAQFQETHRREDTVTRRALNQKDILFLLDLQKELNTQDTMCNADPRFWVIRQTEEFPVPENMGGSLVIVDDTGSVVAHDIRELFQYADSLDRDSDNCFLWKDEGHGYWSIEADDDEATLSDVQEILDFLEDHGFGSYTVSYVDTHGVNVQDTLFLTHKDCEDHLRRYGYNYKPDAHAFAMTADRSPRFEYLLKMLQSVDWNALMEHAERCTAVSADVSTEYVQQGGQTDEK